MNDLNTQVVQTTHCSDVVLFLSRFLFSTSQAEADIASREKSAEQLQDDLAAQDESIAKLSKEKKNLEAAKQVPSPVHLYINI